ncbi:gram-negative bacteria-binding protein 3 isoform X2 [Agrilus planipennis]|uniref:Gram-negative bacteria-binding protein 3 isoform X2 n=1 Tax=Agrilus planipennis TaxID=224129 RepID=A0A1W4WVR8_AGRPL|nr:gram-negative bacteria-binding protein 3 isoform X2 [Agrilus planipennis]
MIWCLILVFVQQLFSIAFTEYTVPKPEIKINSKGLKVSIPDEDGIQLFAFHGNVNKEMDGLEAGQMSVDIIKKKKGKWTYRNKSVKVKPGDIIYYWLFVIKDGLGYRYDDGKFVYNGQPTTLAPSTTTYKVNTDPDIDVRIL